MTSHKGNRARQLGLSGGQLGFKEVSEAGQLNCCNNPGAK